MATNPRDRLPQRFRPFFDQSQTQAELRYGGQTSALAQILGQVTRDYQRQSAAQTTAGASLMGALRGADTQLTNTYNDAGLTPTLLAQIGNSPTGQRLAGELASNRAAVQQQATGAQAGQQYLHQRLGDEYRDDVGQVSDQLQALTKERGLYTSSLLDQLISGDRAARSQVNAAVRKQQHDDTQAQLDRETAQGNALIGQGLVVGEDGTLTPLPGGKADPNAPANQPKPKKPVRATPREQQQTATDYGRALSIAKSLTEGEQMTPALRRKIESWLLNGADAVEGKPVYDTRQKIDGKLNPNFGKPMLNKDGTAQMTNDAADAIPQVDNEPAVRAALDMLFDGAISPDTLQMLHDLGYKVRGLKGVKTPGDVAAQKRRTQAQNRNPHATGGPNERAPGVHGHI